MVVAAVVINSRGTITKHPKIRYLSRILFAAIELGSEYLGETNEGLQQDEDVGI